MSVLCTVRLPQSAAVVPPSDVSNVYTAGGTTAAMCGGLTLHKSTTLSHQAVNMVDLTSRGSTQQEAQLQQSGSGHNYYTDSLGSLHGLYSQRRFYTAEGGRTATDCDSLTVHTTTTLTHWAVYMVHTAKVTGSIN